MRIFQSLRRRLQSLREKDANNVELDEELRFHVERQVEENIAGGMTPGQARAAAMAGFGSVVGTAEDCYEARGVGWIEDLVQDVRYGWRTLTKHRSFTFVIVLTLALGIGACTAIFSVVNAVLIRSLPYGDAGKLVYLYTPNSKIDVPVEVFGPSNADFFDLKRQSHSYSNMSLFEQKIYNLSVGDRPARMGAAKVDGSFFSTLAAAPEFGRGIGNDDERPGEDRVVLISHALWQNMFGGESGVLGQTLRLDGTPYKVVGVMPQGFTYPNKSDLKYGNGQIDTTQLWVPSALTAAQQHGNRAESNGYAIARLKPGVTLGEAQAEIKTLMVHIGSLHGQPFPVGWTGLVRPFRENVLGPIRPLMWLLMGAVGFVLLIACGNAANLLLARAASRTHELGVRATLGARRGRLVRQMLTECLMLSAVSGAAGIGLAYLFLHALLRLDPGDIPRIQDATLDLHVLVFVVCVTVLTGFLFGIVPSLSVTRIEPMEFLKSGGVRGVLGDRRWVWNCLAVAQIALVVVLLAGAGLLLRSYVKVLSVQTGFSASTVAANVALSKQYDTPQKRQAFFVELLERVRSIRGVEAAGLVNQLPLSDSESLSTFWVDGYANEKNQMVEVRTVTPGYLSAMQTPLIAGRELNDADALAKPAAVAVNEAFAKRYLKGGNAIGRYIRWSTTDPWSPVIGVVGDVRNESLEVAAIPQMYTSFQQPNGVQGSSAYIAVRSTLPEGTLVSEVRAVVRSVDPSLAISNIHAMGELETRAMAPRRFQTTLLTMFSAMAMLLATIGVYGLLAYSVRQRIGEIGLRMALGSSRGRVAGLVLREGLVLLAAGLLMGLAGALSMARMLSRFLYSVPPIDPVTFLVVPVVLLFATLCACLIPSWRAAAVDPMDALRHQ
jgi:putative ABC transport system permease protein